MTPQTNRPPVATTGTRRSRKLRPRTRCQRTTATATAGTGAMQKNSPLGLSWVRSYRLLSPSGACQVGQTMHSLIRKEQAARNARIDALGGLTMGADPIGLAVGMFSCWVKDTAPLQVFSVRKAPKGHGQTKLIEGNFRKGDTVV